MNLISIRKNQWNREHHVTAHDDVVEHYQKGVEELGVRLMATSQYHEVIEKADAMQD